MNSLTPPTVSTREFSFSRAAFLTGRMYLEFHGFRARYNSAPAGSDQNAAVTIILSNAFQLFAA